MHSRGLGPVNGTRGRTRLWDKEDPKRTRKRDGIDRVVAEGLDGGIGPVNGIELKGWGL